MSTIQKAFIFIVLVLAFLSATVQLVLFAQRDDWKQKHNDVAATVSDLKRDAKDLTKQLSQVREEKASATADLESQLASTRNELATTQRDLESQRSDKANLESLVSTANAELAIVAEKIEAVAARNDELNTAKNAAEEELAEVKAARLTAEEQLTLARRKADDLEGQTASLEEQVASRHERIRKLEKEVDLLRRYYRGPNVTVPVTESTAIYGRVTKLSKDRNSVFVSIGKDDGVTQGMVFMIYKADGTYAADAVVYNISADKCAATVVKPTRAQIAEGDNVASK